MTKKQAYKKLFRAKDLLYEVLEQLILENLGDKSGENEEFIRYVNEAAENAKAAADMIEEA